MNASDRFHLRVRNGSGLPDASVYVTAFGAAFDPSVPSNHASPDDSFVAFTPEGWGSLVTPTASTSSTTYSYALGTLEAAPDGAYDLYLPACTGRVYFSIGAPLELLITVGDTVGISDPPCTDSTDPNYWVIYDKIQFNWNPAVASPPIAATAAINTTAIDYFGLPLSVSMNGITVGVTQPLAAMQATLLDGAPSATPPQPGLDAAAYAGSWGLLPVQERNGTVVRVLGPTSDQSAVSSFLEGYIQSVWDYYAAASGNTLTIEVDIPGQQTNGSYVGSVNADGDFVFTNSGVTPAATVSLPQPVTATIFACSGPNGWVPGNETAQGVIVSAVTAAMNVGILPLPNATVLNNDFSSLSGLPAYYTNTQDGEPAYNLYAALLHSGGDQIYTFAFDNVAGQSGQLTGAPDNVATVKIESLDGVTPPPLTSDATFDVTLVAGAGGSGSVVYKGQTLQFATPATGAPPTTLPPSVPLPAAPAQLTFSYAVGGGAPQSYTIDLVTESVWPELGVSFSGSAPMQIALQGS